MSLESPVQRDGDMGFIGYASRMNPVTLPAGMLQLSENMRLDRGVAVTRKGAKRLADSISPGTTPLTVPFILTAPPNAPVVQSSYSGGIFASAVMRSPDELSSQEIIVLAGPDRAFTFLTDGQIQGSAAWATEYLGVDADGNLVAEEDLVTDTGEELLASFLPTDITYPIGEIIEPTDKVSMVQAFDRLYLLREADWLQPGWGTQYTNQEGISVAGEMATVYVSGHGYTGGMRVRIEGSSIAAFDGHEFDIENVVDANAFNIAVPSGVSSDATANIKVRRVKPPLYWTGDPATGFVRTPAGVPDVGATYRRLRSVAWASYINNRLIVPNGKQNVLISDILDPDTFDVYWQSFRVGTGGSDFIVGVHPWVDGKVLVFCRKSIWLADIAQYPSADGSSFTTETGISGITLLTDEIGCSARRSITTAGSFVYFLSDSGIYRLDSRLDLKLRGDTRPLSDPISNQIAALNAQIADDSVGLYFANRFYIAVPLAGADNNNGVFIYNQLQEAWETQDIYGFGVGNFLVTDRDSERRVFITNQAGKLMLLDEMELGDEPPEQGVSGTVPVQGKIKTRRYNMGLMTTKRFLRSITDAVLPESSSMALAALTYNPDRTRRSSDAPPDSYLDIANNQSFEEDITIKQPIRVKAHFAEIEVTTKTGRPEIRNISIEAALPSQAPQETRNAA